MKEPGSVQLRDEGTASTVLLTVLREAVAVFPDVFCTVPLPDNPAGFRNTYVELLPQFEAARLASSQRTDIARHLALAIQRHIVWRPDSAGEQENRTIEESLTAPADPLPLRRLTPGAGKHWEPTMVYRGQRWPATRLAALGRELVSRRVATAPAGDALAWVGEHLLEDGGITLSGRKIVVLGGGAEMAPTRHFLEAGADVLWIDRVSPPSDWLAENTTAGQLWWPEAEVDLLTRPHEILATIHAFAAGDPVDLCLYAYAPGQARELRLMGVMNALVDVLPPSLLASVTLLVSPTTPTALSAADRAAMAARLHHRPAWEAAMDRLGLLGRSGCAAAGDAAVSRTVVSIQGTSYQAAQYLGKVMMAESWARRSATPGDTARLFRVSANTAAITRTRSLDHPVFAAAFGGAGAFQIETFSPRLSRTLNGLLAVHDWTNPEPPVPGLIRVHGGIHILPYPLEVALRGAAAIGFVRSPKLLGRLVSG